MTALKWAAIARVTGQLVSWALTLFVLRILTPGDYGLMAIVTVVISILGGLAEFGLGASVVQSPSLTKKDLSRISGLAIGINGAAFVVVVAIAPLSVHLFHDERLPDLIRFAALHFIANALGSVPQAIAQRDLDFKWLARIELVAVVVSAVATFCLALAGAGVWALVIGSVLQAAIRTVLSLLRGFPTPEFRVAGMMTFLRFGGAVTLSNLSWQVVYQSDVLIAARRLAAEVVGLYSVSLHFATLPMQKIMGVVTQVAFPAVARLQGDPDRLRTRLLEATRLLSVFGVAVMWGMSSVSLELVELVLGPKWKGAVFPLQAICIVVPLRMISAVFATAVKGIGQAGLDLRNSIVTSLILPPAFFVGSGWGADGLAMAWVVAIPLTLLLNFSRMANALSLTALEVVRTSYSPFLAGACMYLAVLAARAALPSLPVVWRLLILVAVGAAAYIATLHLLQPSIRSELLRLYRSARA